MVAKPMGRRGMPVPKGAIKKGTAKRLLHYVFHYNKGRMILVSMFLGLARNFSGSRHLHSFTYLAMQRSTDTRG